VSRDGPLRPRLRLVASRQHPGGIAKQHHAAGVATERHAVQRPRLREIILARNDALDAGIKTAFATEPS
jgi:hypothetical protein